MFGFSWGAKVDEPTTQEPTNTHGDMLAAIQRSMAVIELQPSGEVITANDNFLRTFGYSLDDVVGKHHRMFCDHQYAQTEEYREFWRSLNHGEF